MKKQFVVLQGDWGGQVYLTVPNDLVSGDEKVQSLLKALDRLAWSSNGGEGANFYRTEYSEQGISGGMGGGTMIPGAVWVHRWFRRHDVESKIRDLLQIDATVPVIFGAEK